MEEKEFKIIESQEELNSILSERLQRQKQSFEERIKGYEDENNELKKSLENAKEKDAEIKTLEERIKGYELKELKRKIASEFNIPYKLAERIKGETEEEMKIDAKELSNLSLIHI